MDAEKRVELITRNTEEILTIEDLNELIKKGVGLKHYIGFEISGKVHLGTGLMTGLKIADFQKAGVECQCYLATWHAWINNKLGGNLDSIRKAAECFGEILKACIDAMGGDSRKVKFITGDELYHNNDDFWLTLIDVSRHTTLNRALRSISIMGREEGEEVPLAFLFYPAMQVADIFALGANIVHSGIDQRKAHVIARDASLKIREPLRHNNSPYKPVAVHHHLLPGLQKPTVWPLPEGKEKEAWHQNMKMSKSIPSSAVFVLDEPEEIRKKIQGAFCPEAETSYNPVLDWCRHLLFAIDGFELNVERPEKFGGPVTFKNYEELERAFAGKKLHPLDLKKATAEALVVILEPVRAHFLKGRAKKLKQEFEKLVSQE